MKMIFITFNNKKLQFVKGDSMKKFSKLIGIGIIVLFIFFVLFCGLIFVQDNILHSDDLYKQMNEINDNKTLIGLSEEEVIELLGEPIIKSDERGIKSYTYSAGTTVKKNILVGEYQTRYYDLQMRFDENNKVKSTGIQQIP